MIGNDLIREARLRAGLTQAELGARLGQAQSVIGRWERGEVRPSLERVREVVRACDLDLVFRLIPYDDSNVSLIEQTLRMTPAQRYEHLMQRVRFKERTESLRGVRSDA